jgi:spermidine synthase
MVKNKRANQEILLTTNTDEYEKSVMGFSEKFDVIIIDGIRRIECSKFIKDYLNVLSKDGCAVTLDNSDWYKGAPEYLRNDLDLIEIDFHGFGPINNYTWTTSIFISRNFNFKPTDNIQPNYSVSAIHQNGEDVD